MLLLLQLVEFSKIALCFALQRNSTWGRGSVVVSMMNERYGSGGAHRALQERRIMKDNGFATHSKHRHELKLQCNSHTCNNNADSNNAVHECVY